MLTIVTWKWTQPGYRSVFTAEHVNTLASMVRRNLRIPHRFVCFTDDAAGLRGDIFVHNLPSAAVVPAIDGQPMRPNCFRRLWAFGESQHHFAVLGDRFVSIDLDCVITGDLTPLFDVPDDFKMWGDTARSTQYNGSLWLMRTGKRAHVWHEFLRTGAAEAYNTTRKAGMIGTDQAWISHVLGRGEAMWTREDGVYSFRNQVAQRPKRDLPVNAKIIFFHGRHDPWHDDVQRAYPWVREHYR